MPGRVAVRSLSEWLKQNDKQGERLGYCRKIYQAPKSKEGRDHQRKQQSLSKEVSRVRLRLGTDGEGWLETAPHMAQLRKTGRKRLSLYLPSQLPCEPKTSAAAWPQAKATGPKIHRSAPWSLQCHLSELRLYMTRTLGTQISTCCLAASWRPRSFISSRESHSRRLSVNWVTALS